MKEIWQDILGYEGYQASNLGQVRSLDRIDRLGRLWKCKTLKPATSANGYHHVSLCKDGKAKTFQVHRLIYEAFCGEIPDGYEVNHINEDKSDNRLCNLNLMTRKENINYGTGIERCHKALLNGKMAKPVVGMDEQGNIVVEFPSTAEAQRHGYDSGTISSCCRGKKHYHRHKGLIWRYKDGDC